MGGQVLNDAPSAVWAVMALGLDVFYVTNASGRTRPEVASLLRDLGFPAGDADVYTSANTTARGWLL